MGAVADYAEFKSKIEQGQRRGLYSSTGTSQNVIWIDESNARWSVPVPTTAVALTKAGITGGLHSVMQPPLDDSPNQLWLGEVEIGTTGYSINSAFLLVDLLSHQGGIAVTTGATEVQTNLPTAALPRFTNGAGVMAALVNRTTLSGTLTTFTVRYTNQDGVDNCVSKITTIPSTSVNALAPIPLAEGDTGIRKIDGITLAAPMTTGTLGIVLYKPIAMFPAIALPMSNSGRNASRNYLLEGGALAEVPNGAFLSTMARWGGGPGGVIMTGSLNIIEA